MMDLLYPIAAILIGVIMLFFGFKVFRFWLALNGLMIGVSLGMMASMFFPDVDWLPMALAIGLGILIAVLAFTLYKIAFIVSGAVIGALIFAYGIGMIEQAPEWTLYAAYALGALIGGFVAAKIMKPYIILATSLYGAAVITISVFVMLNGIMEMDLQTILWDWSITVPWYYLAGFGILSLIGAVAQFMIFRHKDLPKMT